MTIGHAADTLLRLPNKNIHVNFTAKAKRCSGAQGTRRTAWYVFRNPRRGIAVRGRWQLKLGVDSDVYVY